MRVFVGILGEKLMASEIDGYENHEGLVLLGQSFLQPGQM